MAQYYLKFERLAAPEDHPELRADLADALQAAISYQHPSKSSRRDKSVTARVDRLMGRSFHDDLYVRRQRDERTIARHVGSGQALAVVGERGSGKTTLLRRLTYRPDLVEHFAQPVISTLDPISFGDPRTDVAHKLLYMDLERYGSELETFSEDPDQITKFVVEEIEDALFQDPSDMRNWLIHQAKTSKSFGPLRSHFSIHAIGNSDDAYHNHIKAFDAIHQSCRADCVTIGKASTTLGELLDYVWSTAEVTLTLFVDSLDHLPPDVEENIAVALARASRTTVRNPAFVFAVRDSTYENLVGVMEAQTHLRVVRLRASEHDADLQNLIGEFVGNRIDVLMKNLDEILDSPLDDDQREIVDHALKLWSILNRRVFRLGANSNLLAHLSRWHNKSLSAIGRTLIRQLRDLLDGTNPVSSEAEIIQAIQQDQLTEEDDEKHLSAYARMHLFRKFYFLTPGSDDLDDDMKDDDRIPTGYPFRKLAAELPSGDHLHFPKIRLLEYLNRQPDGEVVFDQLMKEFEPLVSRDTLEGCLESLAAPREPGDTGLVRFANAIARDEDGQRNIALTAKIRPAGQYMREVFMGTSEFLFYSCSQHDQGLELLLKSAREFEVRTNEMIPHELVANFEYRCVVATKYLRFKILPLYEREISNRERFNEITRLCGPRQFPMDAASTMKQFYEDFRPVVVSNFTARQTIMANLEYIQERVGILAR